MRLPLELRHRLNLYARKGSKTSRRRQVRRLEEFVAWCGCDPRQIGKRHVYQYFAAHAFAPSTARDHWYAVRLLWLILGRHTDPPRPTTREDL